ncbi:response regulator [Rhodopirellula sp. JC639]|uniref:response regulator n=1 Tax=Stieleria mannarensis TaxID=2755585 RepID=UPI0015FF76E7|nr:response regulator [Rhodopirellula sp. JC639]
MSPTPTVLIIEDDPVFRRVLSFAVAKSGLAVETCNDGEAGYERLLKGGIDFIVTDFQMPRCGGVELLQRLDALDDYQRPPAILCTAKGLELDSEQLRRDFRLACIMHKPFSPRKLSEVIVRHLEQKGQLTASDTPRVEREIPTLPPLNLSLGLPPGQGIPHPPQGHGDA